MPTTHGGVLIISSGLQPLSASVRENNMRVVIASLCLTVATRAVGDAVVTAVSTG